WAWLSGQVQCHAPLRRATCRRSKDAARRNVAQRASPAYPCRLPAVQEKSLPDSATSAAPTALTATTPDSALPHEAVVIPHHELRFKLLHGIHRHANHNQQRRAAEIKLYVESV